MRRSAEELILALLNPRPGERVLDIGCGGGNHLEFMNRLGLDITGIDASPYMINLARERLGNRCSLNRGIAEDLPYEDNEFDLVVLINTLELLDDPLEALREAGRVARRQVFIGVMNSLAWHCLRTKLLNLFRESLFNQIKFFNVWELKSYIRMAYGPVPVEWRCTQAWPSFMEKTGICKDGLWNLKHWPFGSFLGASVSIVYSVKTNNIPLKIEVKKKRQTIAGELSMEKVDRVKRGIWR
ncbi:MAG: class I SAM-dependent methyltransferase [Deltaproteobacteria bacterium]|nr:class I SAM-dependent methyltransferase [Deltaproteobacteria bacterium]